MKYIIPIFLVCMLNGCIITPEATPNDNKLLLEKYHGAYLTLMSNWVFIDTSNISIDGTNFEITNCTSFTKEIEVVRCSSNQAEYIDVYRKRPYTVISVVNGDVEIIVHLSYCGTVERFK